MGKGSFLFPSTGGSWGTAVLTGPNTIGCFQCAQGHFSGDLVSLLPASRSVLHAGAVDSLH